MSIGSDMYHYLNLIMQRELDFLVVANSIKQVNIDFRLAVQ